MKIRAVTCGLLALVLLGAALATAFVIRDRESELITKRVLSAHAQTGVVLSQGLTHYQLAGPASAPLVVLVHGFSVPAYIWDPTFAALIDHGFQVLRFDLYGRGHSARPRVRYTLDLYSRQLQELLEALHLHQVFTLVGLSMGGPVVTHFANRHPSRIDALVLVDPLVFPPKEYDVWPLTVPLLGEFMAGVYFIPHLAATQADDFFDKTRFPRWNARFTQQMRYRGFRRAILSTVRELVHTDTLGEYAKLGKLDRAVLLIWGKNDPVVPLSDSDKLRELVPRMDFHVIENAGHLSHMEQADAFNLLLFDFLAAHQSAPRLKDAQDQP